MRFQFTINNLQDFRLPRIIVRAKRDKKYERRDHHYALTGSQHTAVHVVAQALVIAMHRLFYHRPSDVNRRKALRLQQAYIAYAAILAPAYLYILLHAEIAGHEALGRQALRVHIDIADGSRELAALSHRADKHFPESDSGGREER